MSDRLKVAWEQILTALLPSLATYVKWEFRVQGASPGPPVTISAAAVSADCPWQTLANITLWPGPSGAYAVPAPGTLVLVEFHEGNPGKPSIAGLDPNNVPVKITLGTGVDPIAMSIPTDAAVTAIVAAFNSHTHTVPAGPGTSGPAIPLIAPAPGSTASTLPVVSQ